MKQTGEQFQDSMSVMFYQSLLPAKYRAFRLDASPRKQANSAICAVNLKDVVNGFKPWKDASPQVSTRSGSFCRTMPVTPGCTTSSP